MDAARFQSFLDAREPARGGTVLSAEPIPGGYSRDTVIAEVRWADGATERFVLRGDPEDERSVFRSDRDREWVLLNALADVPTFRIPRPRWYDSTGEYLGTKCIVSEAVPGSSMQALLDGGADTEQGRRDFVEIISTIHNTPLELVSESIPRPVDWDSFIDSMIAVYDDILDRMGESNPVIHYARRKMRENRPPPVPLALVHGDYQPGNFLLADDEAPVIIDWEFGHIGDPRSDLGYYTQIPMPPQLYTSDPDAFLERYRELTGFTEEQVNPAVVEYFKFVGLANIFRQLVVGAEAIESGEHRGIMGPYMLVAIAHFNDLFLQVAESLPNSWEKT